MEKHFWLFKFQLYNQCFIQKDIDGVRDIEGYFQDIFSEPVPLNDALYMICCNPHYVLLFNIFTGMKFVLPYYTIHHFNNKTAENHIKETFNGYYFV